MVLEVAEGETLCPVPLVKVHQHCLLELRFPVVNRDRIVVPVEAMDERLDGGLVDMPDIRRRLTRLKPLQDHGGIDQSEGVDHDLALHGLDRVDDDGDRAAVELLERLRPGVISVHLGSGGAAAVGHYTCCVLMSTLDSQQPNPG